MKKVFAGMDLHGNNVVIAIMDLDGKRVAVRKVTCEIKKVEGFGTVQESSGEGSRGVHLELVLASRRIGRAEISGGAG